MVAPWVRSTPHGIQVPPMISVVIKDMTARNRGRTIHIITIPAYTRHFLILSYSKNIKTTNIKTELTTMVNIEH